MTRSRGIRHHHGLSASRAYGVWSSMRSRCNNPNEAAYPNYGGRGIKCCERWSDFRNFYADMGEPPRGLWLERVDNDRGYEPGNCVWATRSAQMRNRRTSHLVTCDGRTQSLAAWSEETGIRLHTLHYRLKLGWPAEVALKTPLITQRRGVPRGQPLWGARNGVVFGGEGTAGELNKPCASAA